jgi:hypothetical protein
MNDQFYYVCYPLSERSRDSIVGIATGYGMDQAVPKLKWLYAGFPQRRPGFGSGQSMWGLWWTKWHWRRFSQNNSVSPTNHYSTDFSIIIITRGWHNRPTGGRSAEWTQLHSTHHYSIFLIFYGQDHRGGRSSSPGRVKNFLFSVPSRPALGSTQPPIQWVQGALSPRAKLQGREADHSLPASAELKRMCIYASTPPHAFMA